MKLIAERVLILLLVLVVGGVTGYFIAMSQLPTPVHAAPRTLGQVIADSSAAPTGTNLGELRIVTDPSLVMIVSNYGKDYKCTTDYGGALWKVTDLPEEFNHFASGVANLDVPGLKDVLLEYRTPAKETGKLYADVSTCIDGQLIATTQQDFDRIQAPVKK